MRHDPEDDWTGFTDYAPTQVMERAAPPLSRHRSSTSRRGRWIAGLCGMTAVLLGGAFAVHVATTKAAPSREPSAPSILVPVELVLPPSPTRTATFSASVESRQRAVLSFSQPGRVVECAVELGDRVRRGAALARIDGDVLLHSQSAHQASLREARAQLDLARTERRRAETLGAAGATTPRDTDRAVAQEATLEATTSRLRALSAASREAVEESVLVAPFDGTITDVWCRAGEIVAAGVPVASISGGDENELRVNVPETSLTGALAPGLEVVVSFPLQGGYRALARVRAVGRSASGGTFPVILDLLDDGAIPAGVTADVELPVATRGAFAVPVEAIVDPVGRRPRVWVVRDGRAVRVDVEVHELAGGRVLVDGDMHVGEPVIVGRHPFLLPGDRVRAVSSGRG